MRSKTSIISTMRTVSPVSSFNSRMTPFSSDSPSSSVPPGIDHCPSNGSLPAPNQQRAAALDHHASDANDRPLGIFPRQFSPSLRPIGRRRKIYRSRDISAHGS